MIRIGIVGGAGYTGGELLRLLLRHPWADIRFVHSRSQAGKAVCEVHADLIGETDLQFTDRVPQEDADVLFLCMGHGESQRFLQETEVRSGIKIIDLSQDFRVQSPENRPFVYGLPEAHRSLIRQANYVANPGCFATAIQLAFLPLAKKHLLQGAVHVTAITGSTGAGQSPKGTTHYSWRNNNISVYKAFAHQHLGEIKHNLKQWAPEFDADFVFVPMRGSFTRGILASLYTRAEQPLAFYQELYRAYFAEHPFVFISEKSPDVKQVVNTNKAVLHLEKHDGWLHVVSVIDNLLKGASGQAVQNMNLMFGTEETLGLLLKPVAF
jgi:N-acetyl-gamma-glutamyl-phosphate reductase